MCVNCEVWTKWVWSAAVVVHELLFFACVFVNCVGLANLIKFCGFSNLTVDYYFDKTVQPSTLKCANRKSSTTALIISSIGSCSGYYIIQYECIVYRTDIDRK